MEFLFLNKNSFRISNLYPLFFGLGVMCFFYCQWILFFPIKSILGIVFAIQIALYVYFRYSANYSVRTYLFYKILTLVIFLLLGFLRAHVFLGNLEQDNRQKFKNFQRLANQNILNAQKYNKPASSKQLYGKQMANISNKKKEVKGMLRGVIRRCEYFPNHVRLYLDKVSIWRKKKAIYLPGVRLRMFFPHIIAKDKIGCKNVLEKIQAVHKKLSKGSVIFVKSCVYEPSQPVLPCGYNLKQALFFKDIMLTGHTIAPLKYVFNKSFYNYNKLNNKTRDKWYKYFFSAVQRGIYKLLSLPKDIRNFLYNKILFLSHIKDEAKNQDVIAIILALTTGDKFLISQQLRDSYSAAGISHILAISGLHMATLALIVMAFCKFILMFLPIIGRKFDPRFMIASITIVVLILYLSLCSQSISATRSFIMTIIAIYSLCYYRHYFATKATTFAALIILCVDPTAIFSISFHLSFAAVLTLINSYSFLINISHLVLIKAQKLEISSIVYNILSFLLFLAQYVLRL